MWQCSFPVVCVADVVRGILRLHRMAAIITAVETRVFVGMSVHHGA